MKIISNYQDFYDNCRSYGEDKRLVWERREEIFSRVSQVSNPVPHDLYEVLKPAYLILHDMPYLRFPQEKFYRRREEGRIPRRLLLFCGKAYPIYQTYHKNYNFYELKDLIKFFEEEASEAKHELDIESVKYTLQLLKREHLSKNKNKQDLRKRRRKSGYWPEDLDMDSWEVFKKETNFNTGDAPHLAVKSPTILISREEVIVNPVLQDLDFPTQMDPFTTYQELSMYIGNNLAQQMDPEVNIPDKIRAESKGFNDWSFRTHPSESKKPRGK